MYRWIEDAPPRLAREGWIPAGPDKRTNKRAMLIPKTGHVADHIEIIKDFSEVLCPADRRALREIVAGADVVHQGKHAYLVARVSPDTLDTLATFETSRADLEDGVDQEEVSEDGDDSDLEPDHDNEYDYLNAEPH